MKSNMPQIRAFFRTDLALWAPSGGVGIYCFSQHLSLKYAAGVFLCCLLLVTTRKHLSRFLDHPWKHTHRLLFAAMCAISISRYHLLADVGDVDFACYTSALANTLHGRFLYQSFIGQSILSAHSCYTLTAFLPVFLLAGNIGLLIAQSAIWAWGLLWLLRSRKDNAEPSVLLVVACALSPCFLPAPLFGFHVDILFVPITGLAVWAYQKHKLGWYAVAMSLYPMTKEYFALASIGFGIVAMLERRQAVWKWYPIVTSVVLSAFFWYILSPWLRPPDSGHFFASVLPNSLQSAMKQFLGMDAWAYILVVTLAYGPIVATGAGKWLLLPSLFVLFNALLPDSSFRDLWRHYSIPVGTLFLIPLVFVGKEDLRRIAMPVLFAGICAYPLWRAVFSQPSTPLAEREAVEAALQTIPSNGSLLAHGPFMSKAAEKHFRTANWIYRPENWQKFEYVLMDLSYRPAWWSGAPEILGTAEELRESGNWQTKYEDPPIVLFRRNGKAKLNPDGLESGRR